MIHVINRTADITIKNYIIDCRHDLQKKVRYEIT